MLTAQQWTAKSLRCVKYVLGRHVGGSGVGFVFLVGSKKEGRWGAGYVQSKQLGVGFLADTGLQQPNQGLGVREAGEYWMRGKQGRSGAGAHCIAGTQSPRTSNTHVCMRRAGNWARPYIGIRKLGHIPAGGFSNCPVITETSSHGELARLGILSIPILQMQEITGRTQP